jgi:hypothetical protein
VQRFLHSNPVARPRHPPPIRASLASTATAGIEPNPIEIITPCEAGRISIGD